ncbi:MAG: hypothetical protein KIT89_10320 [Microcella sp.]|uniref:InlB B-repeat-containing protein n=1 Tax=Microcella sp. TaxID=1913979 RepID=UPI0024CADC6C|nr:hypothetical protein [Microcella sp.]UYN83088.1 MAG: hypothetical protein KIT89_10320 [Microcella sp.]
MNAKKFLAACTAVALTLGFSLGASSVAFADEAENEAAETTLDVVIEEQLDSTEQRTTETEVEAPVQPAHHNPGHTQGGGSDAGITCDSLGYQKPDALDDIEGGIGSYGLPDIAWGSLSWDGKSVSWTINDGYTVDICVKGGNTAPHEATGETEGGGHTHGFDISHLGFRVTSVPSVSFEVALYLYKKLDPNAPASWPNSGPQTLIDFKAGTEWFTEFPADLPVDVCGSGWAVQQDKVSYTGTFTWPNSITYPHDNIGWPPIYDAKHDNLENYVDVPDCEVATAVVTVAERDCYVGTSFVIDEENSENVTWGEPVIDDEGETISITATANPGSKFDGALEGVSDDGSQRTFVAKYEPADDCELSAVVVPLVTWVDECVDEIRLDLAAAALVGVASFTVTDSPNVSYSYTINGGASVDVVFPIGEDTVTIVVTPGDTVVVTAAAADGYQLPEGYEPFVKEFVESEFCLDLETGPATTASVEFTLGECEGDSSVELVDEGGVVWRINGVIVAGNTSHTLTAGSEVEVTATLAEPSEEFPLGWTWSDPEQVTSWEETVAASDPNCDPELLATTGLASMGEHLGLLAVLLTLTGMGLVARKHRTTTA